MLFQIHRRGIFPMRQSGQRKIDDAVERRFDVGKRQVVPVKILGQCFRSGPRLGRRLADQQPPTCLGLASVSAMKKPRSSKDSLLMVIRFRCAFRKGHFAAAWWSWLRGKSPVGRAHAVERYRSCVGQVTSTHTPPPSPAQSASRRESI